ncbi:DUF4395 domain-containing protein [Lampropedia puyangensis]|uniref:DUF4395 domain-containing protein n=1 Tax=Lampropedia puyangensis TaxID=1330072 RepID=A0A4S8FHU3_9BURK|nr:DUF4395 family protein [Lampropedia puyangensis]THU05292.1 DUF4395 domain-containing protein [Lampropedia puyangensis]
MLRFDLPPVWSNVTRWEAFVSFLVCLAAWKITPWCMGILVVQGFVRGFLGHYFCPLHRVLAKSFEINGWAGKKENAGAKMFANKVLFIASSVSLLAYSLGSPLWIAPCFALMLFTTLEWAFSFCAACSVYGFWYRVFPPQQNR